MVSSGWPATVPTMLVVLEITMETKTLLSELAASLFFSSTWESRLSVLWDLSTMEFCLSCDELIFVFY